MTDEAVFSAIAAPAAEPREPARIDTSRMLPYGFARNGQILLANQHDDGTIEVWISDRTPISAIAEVSRNLSKVSLVCMPADELAQAINTAYARQDGSAAQVVG
ncbi:type II secretion system protein GspE, partial [Paraburkholderia sp. SARCC-3016]|nr:type II secretion system protein GspE [Paraburkholderia sp. SARCC-3016]